MGSHLWPIIDGLRTANLWPHALPSPSLAVSGQEVRWDRARPLVVGLPRPVHNLYLCFERSFNYCRSSQTLYDTEMKLLFVEDVYCIGTPFGKAMSYRLQLFRFLLRT